MRDLLASLMQALDARRDCVFCRLVETRGSTPQKAGAAMIVFADGTQAGTLGGGCVEAEVKQRSLGVLHGGATNPQVLSFFLDDNYGWDDGLICGGRMTILAEPLSFTNHTDLLEPACRYYRALQERVGNGRGCTEVLIVDDQVTGLPLGTRYLIDEEQSLVVQVGETPLPDQVSAQLRPLKTRPAPMVQRGFCHLPILPRVTLLIVGGGHVGQAVARLAATVDFDIEVLDDRVTYASAERFPMARQRIVGDIGTKLKERVQAGLDSSTWALIVTRGHSHDEEALYHLAPTACGYVGMIGSRRKIKLIYDDLLAKGIAPGALARVHAPLGFNIGSQTVPEIAVSIVAELISCRNLGATIPTARINVPVEGRV